MLVVHIFHGAAPQKTGYFSMQTVHCGFPSVDFSKYRFFNVIDLHTPIIRKRVKRGKARFSQIMKV